jgi:hypothetical protein
LLSALARCKKCKHWHAAIAVSTDWLHYQLSPQASAPNVKTSWRTKHHHQLSAIGVSTKVSLIHVDKQIIPNA